MLSLVLLLFPLLLLLLGVSSGMVAPPEPPLPPEVGGVVWDVESAEALLALVPVLLRPPFDFDPLVFPFLSFLPLLPFLPRVVFFVVLLLASDSLSLELSFLAITLSMALSTRPEFTPDFTSPRNCRAAITRFSC